MSVENFMDQESRSYILIDQVMQVRKKDTGKIYAMKVLKKAELVRRGQVDHTKTERKVCFSLDFW